MNEEIKKKLGELFELCIELNQDKFVVDFRCSNYLDSVDIMVRIDHDPCPEKLSAYTDDKLNKVLGDIFKARFELTELHHEFKYGSAA